MAGVLQRRLADHACEARKYANGIKYQKGVILQIDGRDNAAPCIRYVRLLDFQCTHACPHAKATHFEKSHVHSLAVLEDLQVDLNGMHVRGSGQQQRSRVNRRPQQIFLGLGHGVCVQVHVL